MSIKLKGFFKGFTFVPNKSFGKLLEILSTIFKYLKAFN